MSPVPNPTTAVNPSIDSIRALAARPDRHAIIMVNLLRFTPDGGREAYARYGAVASGTVRDRGGSIALTAPVIDDAPWDVVTLVRYPRRAAYLDMQNDPAYVGAIPDRTTGLAARLLYPFHPADNGNPDDPFRIERTGGDEVFLVSLTRFVEGTGSSSAPTAGGEIVLQLVGDSPMVTDDRWDQLSVIRYPSLEAVQKPPSDSVVAGALHLIVKP